MIELSLICAQATEALGGRLAQAVCSVGEGGIIYLRGELGAGKTTLVRGLVRALGHQGAVKSPTYTLVEPYTVGGLQVFHVDLYRLGDAEELEFIGLRDFLEGYTLLLVEWPERGLGALPVADLDIEIRYVGTGRLCRLQSLSTTGEAMLISLIGD